MTTKRIPTALAAAALGGLLATAAAADPLPRTLDQTGLCADAACTRVRPENLPFKPQYPLWSDGAQKRRWIFLPAPIDASQPDAWRFPVGTKLWKEFRIEGRPVETRFIERTADGWQFASYVWNADGTRATLAPDRGVSAVAQVAPQVAHDVPGQDDCRSCHEGRPTPVLGFDALQLSPDRDPLAPHAEAKAADDLDLRRLVARGLVKGLPPRLLRTPPRIRAANPVERAARGYLHANCGGCHNGEGPLRALDVRLAAVVGGVDDGVARSLLNAVSHFQGADGARVRVQPGDPARSTLVARMRSRDPVAQMPPLGTKVVDAEGLRLIERWISQLGPIATTENEKENRP